MVGRGDSGDCTKALSSPTLARSKNPPSRSVTIPGKGVLTSRSHLVTRDRALRPSSLAPAQHLGNVDWPGAGAMAYLLGIGAEAVETQQHHQSQETWIGWSVPPLIGDAESTNSHPHVSRSSIG